MELKATAKGVGVTFGAMFAVAGISSLLEKFDRFAKVGQRLGMSAETIQRMDHAAQLAGTDVEALAKAMTRATIAGQDAAKGLATYTDAFGDLGISVDAFNAASPEEKLKMIEAAFLSSSDRSVAYAATLKILGTRAQELIPLFGGMGDAMDAASVVSDKNVKQIEAFNDAITSLKNSMVGAITPILNVLNAWIEHMKLVGNVSLKVMEGIGGAVSAVAGRDFKLLRQVIEETHQAIIDLGTESTKNMAEIFAGKPSKPSTPQAYIPEQDEGAGSESGTDGRANRRDFVMSGLAAQEEAAMKAEADRKASEGQQYADYSSAIDSMLGRKGANEEALKGTAKFMGSADSLQRIGGGGGAVSSANPQIKKLEELIRQDKEGVAHLKFLRDNIGKGNTLG
jgi:hypothetical protein